MKRVSRNFLSVFTSVAQKTAVSLARPSTRKLNSPLTSNQMPRSGGIPSMMRLPVQETSDGLDVCFVGIPLDTGTSNRSGTRLGPRHIRLESCTIHPYNPATGAAPFESLRVADVGDIAVNPYNHQASPPLIRQAITKILSTGCTPLVMGGDHSISYPILQAIKEKYGPVGLIHIDAHSDTDDEMFGEQFTHGTPFYRAVEEGLLDCKRVVQIGLRGSSYSPQDFDWAKKQGFRLVPAHKCWYQSLAPLMHGVREQMGLGPVYITFDIDALDPTHAPGTGTPEVGGLTVIQGLEILRGCRGLNIVAGDLVEVSPPFDLSGVTASLAANLLFEMLCVLPNVEYKDTAF